MTLFVVVWVLWNLLAPEDLRFDNYPFIFLTLMLSLQASYAAPLILLAQNRQEVRDRVITEQDRQANARAHADMEFLAREVASLRMALGEVATRDFLRSELRGLLDELDERSGADERGSHRTPARSPRVSTYVGAHDIPAARAGPCCAGDGQRPRDQAPDHRPRSMVEGIDDRRHRPGRR